MRGTLFLCPYNKDPTIWGTLLGSPIFGNSRMECLDQDRDRVLKTLNFRKFATFDVGLCVSGSCIWRNRAIRP